MLKNKKFSIKNEGNKSNKYLVPLLVLLLIAITIIAAFWFKDNRDQVRDVVAPQTTSFEPDPAIQEKIDYSPPTEQDKKESDAVKEQTANEDSSTPPRSSDGRKVAYPTITGAYVESGEISVFGFVGGTIENMGVCTYTFTNGSVSKEQTTEGIADATTTRCKPLIIPSDYLGTGTWSLVLKYSSNGYTGNSSTQEIQVN